MNVTDCFINITSEDPDRLVAFYRDVVGLQLKPEMGDHSFHVGPGATLSIDGHSETHGRSKEPSRILINFFVEDVKAERERMEAAGVAFTRKEGAEFWGGLISTFTDPDGSYCQIVGFDPAAVMPAQTATA